jgi:hypothetical protein
MYVSTSRIIIAVMFSVRPNHGFISHAQSESKTNKIIVRLRHDMKVRHRLVKLNEADNKLQSSVVRGISNLPPSIEVHSR